MMLQHVLFGSISPEKLVFNQNPVVGVLAINVPMVPMHEYEFEIKMKCLLKKQIDMSL